MKGHAPKLLLFVLGAFACNQVLGIEEAEVDPRFAATGGNPGTGGGGAVACGDVVPQHAGLIRSCLLRVSCYPLVPSFTMSECIAFNVPASTSHDFCTSGARTCDDIEACTGLAYVDPALCAGIASDQWVCDGDVAIRCGIDVPYRVDCAAFGATCEPYLTGATEPHVWPCRVASPVPCDEPAGTTHCNGDTLYHCIDGVPYGQRCSNQLAVCNDDIPGAAYCNAFTTTCTTSGVTCDNNAIKICESGYLGTYDGAPAGGSCDTDGTTVGYCLMPGCDKDAFCEEECLDETTMKLCPGGAAFEVDCADYGFVGCVSYVHPRNAAPYVACY